METPSIRNNKSKGGRKRENSRSDPPNARGRPKKSDNAMKKVSLWITGDQDKFLNSLKRTTGIDKSEHHRRAMDLYQQHIESLKETSQRRRKIDQISDERGMEES